jgi:chaperonin GroEL
MIEQKYGDPLLSKDGVTNIRRLYLEQPIQNMAARAVIQTSSMNNRNVGDGTTAVALLTRNLYLEGRKLVAAGYKRMEVAKMLKQTGYDVISQVERLSIPFTKTMLLKVAETSTGDKAIAQMLEEAFTDLGEDAGVLVESYGGSEVYSETVDGFYFNKGFTAVGLTNQPSSLKSYHEGNVPILVSEKRLQTKADIGPILQTLVKEGIRELVLVGEVSPEVLEVLAANWMAGSICVTPVDVPAYEGMRTIFMDDLALLTDADVYTPGANGEDFNTSLLGFAKKVVIDERSTKIIGADGSKTVVAERVKELKEQLKASTSAIDIDIIRDRISRLNGKLAIIHVGAPTEMEREELKLRIDDAVCAIRAAFKDGVVPGGGVTLARVKAGQFNSAYQNLIKLLAENAGENPERILMTVEDAKDWFGYDLKRVGKAPVNLVTAGVLDPTLVVTEIVRNASSIAASLITTSAGTVFVDRESKVD